LSRKKYSIQYAIETGGNAQHSGLYEDFGQLAANREKGRQTAALEAVNPPVCAGLTNVKKNFI